MGFIKDKSDLKEVSPTLNDVAKEVASECKGLPLAIVTIGKALKGESLEGWIAANKRFKDSRHLDNEDVCDGLYNRLLLSYDYLKGSNIRSCFLLCSLFPEDFDIDIELLIFFGIGIGLFSNISLIEDLRREVLVALKKLQESSLLMKSNSERYVKMHDVIRDFAHWITSREKHEYVVKEGQTELLVSESFGCCTAMSFWNSEMNNFPENLKFLELKILIFTGMNVGEVVLPSAFVEGMNLLRVLHLENVIFSLEVFKFTTNLRSLCFEYCKLGDISSLRSLKNLEILTLNNTNIYELPEELEALGRLKFLHFSCLIQPCRFPPNLLSRLVSLQELRVPCKNNVNLLELNSLSRLTALSLRVSSDQCLQATFVFPKLQRYIIAVNRYLQSMEGLNYRILRFDEFSSSLSAFKELFCNVEKLTVERIKKQKRIVPNVDQEGQSSEDCNEMKSNFSTCVAQSDVSDLQQLDISDSNGLDQVFDFHEEMAEREVPVHRLSNLTCLKLCSLPELKWICKGPCTYVSLKSLTVAEIISCNRLRYVFSPSLAQNLVQLQQLQIAHCNALEHIVTCGNKESDSGNDLHPPFLPKLTILKISNCPRLEYVFQIPLAQGLQHLKSLWITYASKLKYVFNVAKVHNGVDHAIALPRLQNLQLQNSINLSCFCSENCPIQSPSLENLIVVDCPLLKNFTIQQEVNKQVQLKELSLCTIGHDHVYDTINCDNIFEVQARHFLSRIEVIHLKVTYQFQCPIQVASFPYLRELKVSNWNKRKSLFSSLFAQNLPQLKFLQIKYCEELEELIGMGDQTSIASSSSRGHLRPIHFPSLEIISIAWCKNLKRLFPISSIRFLSSLQSIKIIGASKLEQIFGYRGEINVDEDDKKGIVFPKLHEMEVLELPSLKSFAPMGYHFRFPSLLHLNVACPNFIFSTSQKEFKVHIGSQLTRFHNKNGVALQAELEDVPLYSSKELLCNAQYVTLDRVMCHKNLIPSVGSGELDELVLTLKDGKEQECLIDTTDHGHVSTGSFFNLVELVIEKMAGLKMLCNGPFPKGFLQNLQKATVINCGQLQEVFQTEEPLHDMKENRSLLLSNLTSLVLKSLPELKWIWKGPSDFFFLQSLKVAEINRCNKLKYLFSPSLAQSLVLLQQLKIECCDELEHIITTELETADNIEAEGGHLHSSFLPELTTLEITDCPKLECVFQIPLAQGLPELRFLSITYAPQLQYVFNVAIVNDGVDHAIAFPSLQDLQLQNLSNLSCFCSENYPIDLSQSLKKLIVVDCPRLKFFTIQPEVNKVVQLEGLRLSESRHDDNLSDTLSSDKLFQIQPRYLSRIDVIYLKNIQLQGPVKVASLQYLRELKVSNCNRLKSLFSSMLARNLLLLNVLHIVCCEDLEQLIEMDDQTSLASSSSQSHVQPIYFPSLELIWIYRCSNLKRVFPTSVIRPPSHLKSIKIHGASKLEQVFGYQGELNVGNDPKGVLFPRLKIFQLLGLPALKSFAPIGYHFWFPSLIELKIERCPSSTTSFSKDSKDIVHAITQAPQQVEYNIEKGFTTTEEIIDNRLACNDIFWDRMVYPDTLPLY